MLALALRTVRTGWFDVAVDGHGVACGEVKHPLAVGGATIVSGAAARTIQVRHSAPAGQSASYWEHAEAQTDATAWARHHETEPNEEKGAGTGQRTDLIIS